MMKRIALVTGANKGLGLETAKQLAEKGIHVLLSGRNEQEGQQAVAKLKSMGLAVEFLQLDVTQQTDIEAVYQHIQQHYGKLDILVNNAGIIHAEESWGMNSSTAVSLESLKNTFDINFFGLVAVTQALLPLLKKSEAGRITNVSSILGSATIHSDPASPWYPVKPFAYNASKAAVNAFTIHLAAALKDSSIKVNSAHPGWVKTDLGTDAAPLEVADGAATSVQLSLAEQTSFSGKFIHNSEELPW